MDNLQNCMKCNKCMVTIHWCIHGCSSPLLGRYLFDWHMWRLYKQLSSMWVLLCCQYWLMYCNNGWLMPGVGIRVFVWQCCQQMYFHCWQWLHILLSMYDCDIIYGLSVCSVSMALLCCWQLGQSVMRGICFCWIDVLIWWLKIEQKLFIKNTVSLSLS